MFNDDNYVLGDQNVQVPAHLNFGKFILDRLRLKNHEVALEHAETHEKLTYKEFTQYAVNTSVALTKLGVRRGDIVAVGSEKRNEFVPTVLAIVFSGATYNPYDLQSGKATLKHKISITKPKYFICSNLFWSTYSDILKSFDCIEEFITLDEGTEPLIPIRTLVTDDADVNKFEPVQVQGQSDVAYMLYSSGTTGMPKCVQLTHLISIINSLPDNFSDESLKTAFVFGEWYHAYDIFMMFKFLYLGRKIVYTNEGDPISFLKCVQDCNVNIAFIVPSFVCYLSQEEEVEKFNLDSLKFIYCGAWPLHKKTIEHVKSRFPNLVDILQIYGMSEAFELTTESWAKKIIKPGSVGKATPGITLKVVDPITRQTVGPNQCGEICLRGPMLMKGYIGIPPSNYLDEDGFFKTGDLGYYDEEEYFFIVNRIKEIIIYDGYNVAPAELETILQLHPGVKQVAVLGKPVPIYGEEPTAFVVKQPGVEVSEKELIDYVAKEVTPFMQLRGGVRFIEEMPRNPRGKIIRQRLKEMLK